MRYLIEYIFFRTLSFIACLFPRWFSRILGRALGRAAFALNSRYKKTSISNLKLAFNEALNNQQRKKVAKQAFSHFGEVIIQLLRTPWLSKKKIARIAEYKGLENLRQAYSKGKGVLIFTGHFGNWELMGISQGYQSLPLNVVARPLDNPYLERMLSHIRSKSGNKIIYKKNAVKGILQALKKGEGVAILIDQNTRIEEGIFIDFFGKKASTTPLLASLALRSGASIIPAFALPREKGKYLFIYEDEINFHPSDNKENDILQLTQQCSKMIEDYVRKYPQYWFWMHRRWKNQPTQSLKK